MSEPHGKSYDKDVKSPGTMEDNTKLEELTPFTKKKVRRNSPCPCGSGKKFKHCCGAI